MEKKLKDIRTLDKATLIKELDALGEPKFRANQLYNWLWKNHVLDFDLMKNLPKTFIETLKSNYSIPKIEINLVQKSADETIKVGFKTHDDKIIEGVIIPSEKRITACISSQIGCSLSCKFCATGFLKRDRNLLAHEIYDQVFLLNKLALQNYEKPLSNIVYMGMGEPLLNYDEVISSVKLLNDMEEGMGISAKRITISTSGITRNIMKLADEGLKINLALSLHAPNNEKRSKIMEINTSNPIEKLVEAIKYFYDKTGNKITYEYVLLSGVNDSPEDAKELIGLCQEFPVFVNIIEYNHIAEAPFYKSKNDHRDTFLTILRANKVDAKVRISRGKDIDAACGQLANRIQQTK